MYECKTVRNLVQWAVTFTIL